ncbi:hypothetical protein L202_03537 [Cryptococcus amylolentus CBS 6039]|uniref:BIR-domain-containing protein n=2 Tax=Cryptococcus amylolentus TaxID=104669 RepID=A0A1E3HTC0_9TREE|nr:hypothetical protein L202_03537 [Cryptococcus amylolentus CBS 6039]ODN79590.1 hypothetical protein L202_03537 [Cryptococcus amylolentus CBS 6039]ODO07916.1 hypothetical protein I350_03497 [Cryptococcus amylolentus CBS 6273]
MQHLDNRQQSFNPVARPKSRAKPAFPLSPARYPHLTPDSLAQAGFYHTPGATEGSLDNCKCFLCNLELGGWDEEDDPFEEHAKRSNCAWAEMVCAVKVEKRKRDRDVKYETIYETEQALPQSAESIQVRIQTFKKWWPYKQKAGWLPTVKALARAGFVYNPSTESTDAVFCPYCEYGVEGWEATDDPWEIHQSKVPDCHFFRAALSGQAEEPVSKSSRSKKSLAPSKRSKRATTAATAPSEAEETDLEHTQVDDEPASQATTASKRAAKPRATAASRSKGTRGQKKAAIVESEADPEPQTQSESEGEREQPEPEPQSDVEMESQAEDQEPTPVKKPKGRPKGTKATEKKPKASKAKGRSTKAVEEDAPIESEAESHAQQTEPEEEPENQTTPKAAQPSSQSLRSKTSSRSAKPPSQPAKPSSQPLEPSSQPAEPSSQRSKPPIQPSQPTRSKPLPNLPPSSLPASARSPTASPLPLSQLHRFANIPPSSPVVTPRNIATLRTGQPSSRISPHVPLNRSDQDASIERGAQSAHQVMDDLLHSPALASPAKRTAQASRSPLAAAEPQEPGQLPDEIMDMTLEDLVRAEMKKAYEKLRNEGEAKIEQWAKRAAGEREKIEAL